MRIYNLFILLFLFLAWLILIVLFKCILELSYVYESQCALSFKSIISFYYMLSDIAVEIHQQHILKIHGDAKIHDKANIEFLQDVHIFLSYKTLKLKKLRC